jgi:hypothetical protein
MSFIQSIDSARSRKGNVVRRPELEGASVEERIESRFALLESVLLPGECRWELRTLFSGLISQYRPTNAEQLEVVTELAGIRWRLMRVDRKVGGGDGSDEQRSGLVWDWHRTLVRLRSLLANAPKAPLASRLRLISNQEPDLPAVPDRRTPREPSLPTWAPWAA